MTTRRAALHAAAAALALTACDGPRARGADMAGGPVPPLKSLAPCPVGSCVMTPQLSDPAFVALIRAHFNQITPEGEMKMERVLADDGTFRFDAADRIADFARANGWRLHGTTLVWYAQDPAAFRRVAGDRRAFENAYRNYILAVAGRYRGLASGWDVVNEAVAEDGDGYRSGVWGQALGEDYAALAFEHAKEADPGAIRFLNDYNLETMPAKLDAFQRLLERLLKRGAPVNGVGIQSHLSADLPRGYAARAIRALASFGLPIHVSELDVSTRPTRFSLEPMSGPAALDSQARVVGEVVEAFMDLPPAQRYAFTVWGVRDEDSWLRRPPNAGDGADRPLLFDDAGRPKPAFQALAAGFRRA